MKALDTIFLVCGIGGLILLLAIIWFFVIPYFIDVIPPLALFLAYITSVLFLLAVIIVNSDNGERNIK